MRRKTAVTIFGVLVVVVALLSSLPPQSSLVNETGTSEQFSVEEATDTKVSAGRIASFWDNITRIITNTTPRPHRPKKATLHIGNASAVEDEYIRIEFEGLAIPENITGWKAVSQKSGVAVSLPRGVRRFIIGAPHTPHPVVAQPGDTVYLHSGFSPVGASFAVNVCSGYLEQFQHFIPYLTKTCPEEDPPIHTLPESMRGTCSRINNSLPTCTTPADINAPEACKQLLVKTYNYNSCVERYRDRPDFHLGEWRLYANRATELWSNEHDVIELHDQNGVVVDTLTY